jgi:hypothetical protein
MSEEQGKSLSEKGYDYYGSMKNQSWYKRFFDEQAEIDVRHDKSIVVTLGFDLTEEDIRWIFDEVEKVKKILKK